MTYAGDLPCFNSSPLDPGRPGSRCSTLVLKLIARLHSEAASFHPTLPSSLTFSLPLASRFPLCAVSPPLLTVSGTFLLLSVYPLSPDGVLSHCGGDDSQTHISSKELPPELRTQSVIRPQDRLPVVFLILRGLFTAVLGLQSDLGFWGQTGQGSSGCLAT